ncbi:MAG: hypothetical protein ACRCZD_20465 [Phycicoccus sp.]
MSTPRRLARPFSSLGMTGLLVATSALVAATILLPWPVAAWWAGTSWHGPDELARAVGDGLVSDWTNRAVPGDGGSGLLEPSRFWGRFHLVKAVLAALLLGVAVTLTVRCWSAAGSTRRRTAAWRAAGVAGGGLAGLALLVMVANVQGTVVPLSSVISFLPAGPEDAAVVAAVGELQSDLAAGPRSPVAETLLHDFSVYHAVMAGLGAITAVAIAALVLRLWRRRHRGVGVPLVVVSLAFALVTAANIGTALDPTPALDTFLRGVTG